MCRQWTRTAGSDLVRRTTNEPAQGNERLEIHWTIVLELAAPCSTLLMMDHDTLRIPEIRTLAPSRASSSRIGREETRVPARWEELPRILLRTLDGRRFVTHCDLTFRSFRRGDDGLTYGLYSVGVVGVILDLVPSLGLKIWARTRFALAVVFVLGTCSMLVATDVLTANLIADLFVVLLAVFWLLSRILLSYRREYR